MSDQNDTRNLIDIYKGLPNQDIVADLEKKRLPFEIAIENLTHDFNIGSIVRTANAFNARRVHIIGQRRWNQRGAMVTNRYMNVVHHPELDGFLADTQAQSMQLYAIENNVPDTLSNKKTAIEHFQFQSPAVLVFGSENNGISSELLMTVDEILSITQYGSTRSINVGAAAAIAMYVLVQQLTTDY
jgi:tRNA G18 (ribose-2'-O)-methylase SpoU